MSADGDVQGAFPPDTGVRVGLRSGSSVLVSGVPVECGYLSPAIGEGSPVALLRWEGAWLALGSISATAPALTVSSAGTGGSISLTTSLQAVPSTSIALTLPAGTRYHAIAVFDFNVSTAAATVATGSLVVDAVQIASPQANFSQVTAAGRGTVSQQWFGTLTAGSHTLELQVSKTVNLGVITALPANTTLTVRLGA